VDKNLAKVKIKEALIKAIQTSGHKGFSISQTNCPVDTGELKKSGSDKNLDNGIEIDYTASYSSEVERGTLAGNRNVKPHFRSGHSVKAYSYYSKGQKANPFIENAIHEAFSNFSKDFDSNLRSSFSSKEAKIQR
jgi:hypothetical protein